MANGPFGNSLKRELGKNTGKFISNVIFGDKHSTPYRRVSSYREPRVVVREPRVSVRVIESQNRLAEEEARRDAEVRVARIQADLERENQTRAAELEKLNLIREADLDVERNIASLNSEPIPTTVPELLQSLTALSVQLKANPWKKEGEDAERRNKYTEALLEKFVLSVQELEFIDSTDPHLKHFKSIARKAKRKKFFKNNGKWAIPLIVSVSVIILATLPFLIIPLIDIFMDYPVLFYTVIVVCIGGFIAIKLLKKPNKPSIKKNEPTGYNKTEERQPYVKEQAPKVEAEQESEPEPEQSVEEESVFFDLNEDERIEKKLANIWMKYDGKVDSSIMKRKPIFSADGVKDSILFVGVNPSYNPDDDEILISSNDHNSLMYGSFYQRADAPEYFKSLEQFASWVGKGYTHMNLLYAREDNREALIYSNSDFIREQLELSYETIIKIQPCAIIFFTDYCKDMIFGADRWVDPSTEDNGHYILRGTTIPIYFSDDVTIMPGAQKLALARNIQNTI